MFNFFKSNKIVTKLLTETEFKATMSAKMRDITSNANPKVDIWSYAQLLREQKTITVETYENRWVEIVYQNDTKTFDHVLLPTNDENVFAVIVINLAKKTILGHYVLNLTSLYSIS